MVNVSDDAKEAEAKAKQRAASKVATFEKLKLKQLATREFTVYVEGEPLVMKYRAIGHQEYDRLVAKNPPSTEDKAEGAIYNTDTFAPALISAVSEEPKLTFEEAKELWNSSDWSRGDLMVLFSNAVDLCNTGFNVPFNKPA